MALPGAARAQGDRDLPGPIDSLQDLQDTGRMLFQMADTNHDGQLSQQEAINGALQALGGPFFRRNPAFMCVVRATSVLPSHLPIV